MEPTDFPRYDATVEQSKLLGEALKYAARNRASLTVAAIKGDEIANKILDRYYELSQGDYKPRRIAEFIQLVGQWEAERS